MYFTFDQDRSISFALRDFVIHIIITFTEYFIEYSVKYEKDLTEFITVTYIELQKLIHSTDFFLSKITEDFERI